MKKLRLKRWVKVLLTILVIHFSFFIWRQTGWMGKLAQKDTFYLIICILSWIYLIVGQTFIYGIIWEK